MPSVIKFQNIDIPCTLPYWTILIFTGSQNHWDVFHAVTLYCSFWTCFLADCATKMPHGLVKYCNIRRDS